ncbi:MAG: serine O-acetyltransferase [Chloroflexota bacterium]|nr:serine O-acetyltransferase [Chloroflexota bacterium]
MIESIDRNPGFGSRLVKLWREVDSVLERDPAATSRLEVLLTYSGFHAVQIHRVAHWLYRRDHRLAARAVSQFNRWLTQVEIHPAAKIGARLFIDHGAGVVIGETAEVGDDVTILQGVTLGGTGKQSGKRHPTIGNHVSIGTGAKLLGGFTVGSNSRIGANAVVLREVPPNSTVVGVPGRVVVQDGKRTTNQPSDLNWIDMPDPEQQDVEQLLHRIQELESRLMRLESSLNRAEPRPASEQAMAASSAEAHADRAV